MKKNVSLLMAVVMGVLAVFLIYGYLKKMRSEVYKGMEMVKVMVAAEDISKGETIGKNNVAARSYPSKYVDERAIRPDQLAVIMGAVVKMNLQKGRPVMWSDIEKPGEISTGLSSLLGKGMRAVTLPVTEITGVANQVKPNNRVDILFSFDSGLFSEKKSESDDIRIVPDDVDELKAYFIRKMTEGKTTGRVLVRMFSNVLVLATGTKTGQAQSASIPGMAGDDSYNSVTLALDAKDSCVLAYCREVGNVSLVLRNPRYNDTGNDRQLVTRDTLKEYMGTSVAPQ